MLAVYNRSAASEHSLFTQTEFVLNGQSIHAVVIISMICALFYSKSIVIAIRTQTLVTVLCIGSIHFGASQLRIVLPISVSLSFLCINRMMSWFSSILN